jgi:hypothetical protein
MHASTVNPVHLPLKLAVRTLDAALGQNPANFKATPRAARAARIELGSKLPRLSAEVLR